MVGNFKLKRFESCATQSRQRLQRRSLRRIRRTWDHIVHTAADRCLHKQFVGADGQKVATRHSSLTLKRHHGRFALVVLWLSGMSQSLQRADLRRAVIRGCPGSRLVPLSSPTVGSIAEGFRLLAGGSRLMALFFAMTSSRREQHSMA
jgi:hypothetical protein